MGRKGGKKRAKRIRGACHSEFVEILGIEPRADDGEHMRRGEDCGGTAAE